MKEKQKVGGRVTVVVVIQWSGLASEQISLVGALENFCGGIGRKQILYYKSRIMLAWAFNVSWAFPVQ